MMIIKISIGHDRLFMVINIFECQIKLGLSQSESIKTKHQIKTTHE